MASKVEVVVVGAGIVGLAVARALSALGKEVLLVERAGRIGSETSSRNSEVVHAGLYYHSSSLKARFCVRGRQLLYNFCESHAVLYHQCGKLVVATDQGQMTMDLPGLYEQAQRNGVNDVKLISSANVKFLEPHVESHGALWSPSTGIVDSHALMVSILADAEAHGVTLVLNTNIDDVIINHPSLQLQIHAAGMWLSCDYLVNCAGLWADQVAAMLHRQYATTTTTTTGNHPTSSWQPPKQYFCKGTYFCLEGQKAPFTHLVYPLPDRTGGGLGVHATIDMTGRVKFGPDVEWLPKDIKPDQIDWAPNPERARFFYDSIGKYWPGLLDGTLVPDYCGVRPKLSHPDDALLVPLGADEKLPFTDFQIVGPEVHAIPGLVHLFGIESPGLTSSLAIAAYITERYFTK